MKIVCLSDTHHKHQYINKASLEVADMIIHAGDFTSNGNQAQTISFLQWYESLDIEHKILVAGNHDSYACSETFQYLLDTVAPSVIYLNNESTTIAGLNIFGSPYSNTFGHWAFMKDDEELYDIWQLIPENTHIVVTHGPAYRTADKVLNPIYDRDPHVGSNSLADKLATLPNLKLHVCGHIHEAAGIYLGNYTTVNASINDLNYVPFNQPVVLNVN